jgi:hypothetical protein
MVMQMQKLVLTIALLVGSSAAHSSEELVSRWAEANTECRGGVGEETNAWCEVREGYGKILTGRNWCYTDDAGAATARSFWHECGKPLSEPSQTEDNFAEQFCSSGFDQPAEMSFEDADIGLRIGERTERYRFGGSVGTSMHGSVYYSQSDSKAYVLRRTNLLLDWNEEHKGKVIEPLIFLFQDRVFWPARADLPFVDICSRP